MPKPLTSQQVAAINKDGNYWIDRNLYLQVRRNGASRSYRLRYRFEGRDCSMGLGSAKLFSLTDARRRAVDALRLVADGIDPIEARRAERRKAKTMTFDEALDAYVDAHKSTWSKKHAENWPAQVKRHCGSIAKVPVDRIDTHRVLSVLKPIWFEMPTTAGKVRSRIETVLDYAKASGQRTGDNPAAYNGNLEFHLPQFAKFQKVVHRSAVPWPEAPRVYQQLEAVGTNHSRLLCFLIQTAVRCSEARWADWSEFDLEAEQPVWVIPAHRAKIRREHRVPLSPPAVAIIEQMRGGREHPTGLVFKGQAPGKPPSDVALLKLLRRFAPDADVHGWRSTVRDWAAEHGYPHDVAEMMLAHTVGNKVTQAYLRTDLFAQRIPLMDAWAEFLVGTAD